MPYKVQSSEKLRKSGADFETKAMLYLMNFRQDSKDMNYFVVDFFNDVTGMDRAARKLWDVQSKASKKATAKAIGRELVTLYKNYVSDFDFQAYILFLGAVPNTFRKNQNLTTFQRTNLTPDAFNRVLTGLKEECFKKEYIEKTDIIDEKLVDFLNQVWFVIDDKRPEDYIREIVKNHPKIIPRDSELLNIFNEIRDTQSSKKNSLVGGIILSQPDEVLAYGRHLTTNEIRLLVLQRIINTNPLEKGIPGPFIDIYSKFPEEARKKLIDECQGSLCRALFNKSSAQGFWDIFAKIYDLIIRYPDKNVDYLYQEISTEMIDECPDFDALSLKYFIAKVKEGID